MKMVVHALQSNRSPYTHTYFNYGFDLLARHMGIGKYLAGIKDRYVGKRFIF